MVFSTSRMRRVRRGGTTSFLNRQVIRTKGPTPKFQSFYCFQILDKRKIDRVHFLINKSRNSDPKLNMPFVFFSSFFEFLNDNPVSSTLFHWLLWSHKHKNFCFISHKLHKNGPCLCKKRTISGVILWHFLNPWISESSPSSCCFFIASNGKHNKV